MKKALVTRNKSRKTNANSIRPADLKQFDVVSVAFADTRASASSGCDTCCA